MRTWAAARSWPGINAKPRAGYTPYGRLIFVIYEEIDERTVYPVTAYEV